MQHAINLLTAAAEAAENNAAVCAAEANDAEALVWKRKAKEYRHLAAWAGDLPPAKD